MKTLRSLSELSIDELGQIYEILAQQHQLDRNRHLHEIGFGMAERDGAVDPQRRDAVIFYVGRKYTPRQRRDRIGPVVQLSIQRGRQRLSVRLATDVIEIDPSSIELTGRQITHQSRPREAAVASVVLVWRIGKQRHFQWSVLTVGHLFWSRQNIPESSPAVSVRVGEHSLRGTLMLRTLPDAGADIAVVGVARDDLISTGVIVKRPSTRALKIRSITSLKNDVGKLGSTTPSATGIPLYVLRYFPRFQSLPQIGTLFHVVKTQSLTSGAFGQGRSGALWQIGRQVAAHQVFAWQAGDYKQAGGQSLHYALRWVQTELANSHHVRKSDVTMRIVRFL